LFGSYTKIVSFDFDICINFIRVNNEIVYARLISSNFCKLSLPSIINFILKRISIKGLTYKSGNLIIDIKELLHDYQHINFDVSDIYLTVNFLNIDLINLSYQNK